LSPTTYTRWKTGGCPSGHFPIGGGGDGGYGGQVDNAPFNNMPAGGAGGSAYSLQTHTDPTALF
jgi:hypothetical protein